MKIHKSGSHSFAKYGNQKLITRPKNNLEDILHILTLNKGRGHLFQ